MSEEVQMFEPTFIENIILELGDIYEVRVLWTRESVLLTGACTIAGLLIGRYLGGGLFQRHVGRPLGGAVGAVTGFGVARMVPLRKVWNSMKEKLKELLYIVFNFLRQLDRNDYIRAYEFVQACRSSRKKLVHVIVEFIADSLGSIVVANMTAA